MAPYGRRYTILCFGKVLLGLARVYSHDVRKLIIMWSNDRLISSFHIINSFHVSVVTSAQCLFLS